MMTRRTALMVLASAGCSRGALGEEITRLSFDIWIPQNWSRTQRAGGLEAHAPDDVMTAILVERSAPPGGLRALDGRDLVDDEMDEFSVEIDEIRSADGVLYRRVEGTCSDDEEPSQFKIRIMLSDDGRSAGLLMVYASTEDLASTNLRSTMDQILRSLRAN